MEDWTDIIGEQLETFEEQLPADDWRVLQQKYMDSCKRKKAAAYLTAGFITSIAAAVALFLLILRTDDKVIDNTPVAQAPPTTLLPQSSQTEEIVSADTLVVKRSILKETSLPVKVVSNATEEILIAEDKKDIKSSDSSETIIEVINDTVWSNSNLIADLTIADEISTMSVHKPMVSIALSAATSGNTSPSLKNPEKDVCLDMAGSHDKEPSKESAYNDTYQHQIPLSFGLSVRIHLSDRMSVNTGLNYTRYASLRTRDFLVGGVEKDRQLAHYLGIPIRVDWMAVNRKSLNLYMGAGVQMDKCIHARAGKDILREKELLFGLSCTMGMQVNISSKLGLYFEPEAYYALNGGSINTFRSDRQLIITFRGGLRINF